MNQLFQQVIGDKTFDQKIFKVHNRIEQASEIDCFSVRELLEYGQPFFRDKVFELESSAEKKYVQIKIKNFK